MNHSPLAPAAAVIVLVAACGARTGLDGAPADAGGADDTPSSSGGDSASNGGDGSTDGPERGDGSDSSYDSPGGHDAGPPIPPSCAPGGPGMTDCGASLESCCTTLPVPAGTYYRTYENDGSGPTDEADPATVTGLRLDAYEVTVGRFRQFAAAWNGGWRPAPGSGKHGHLNGGLGLANSASPGTYEPGWDPSDDESVSPTDDGLGSCGAFSTWTPTAADRENLPIDCVTWPESYAFCIWDGGFLPSESEWEFAAAGGSQQRVYPWGSTDPGTENQYAIYDCYFDPPDTQEFCGITSPASSIAPVGTTTLGISIWGQLDLAGNVWEQTLDGFAPYVDPCVDCAYLVPSAARVVRGGCFISEADALVPPNRFELPQDIRNNYVGFRCARGP